MGQRILVATGGSPWSDAAVDYAIEWAARTHAELSLLTVLNSPTIVAACDESMFMVEQLAGNIESDGKAWLTRAAARAAHAGVMWTTVIRWGHIPTAIIDTANEEGCELIVLGAHAVTGWKRLQIGSIANAVAAKAPQPVLLIKHAPQVAADRPLWRRLLVATGGSAWSDAALTCALSWAQKQRFKLCALHVTHKPRGHGGAETVAGEQILAQAQVKAAAARVPFEAVLATGKIPDTILATAIEKQCDAIVLGSRGLAGWKRLMVGSIANAVAAKTPLPVLLAKHFEPDPHLTHHADADW